MVQATIMTLNLACVHSSIEAVVGSALGLESRFSPRGGLGGLPGSRLGPGQSSPPHPGLVCLETSPGRGDIMSSSRPGDFLGQTRGGRGAGKRP